MRTILNLIVLIFAISCIPTNKNEKKVEVFDIKQYENLPIDSILNSGNGVSTTYISGSKKIEIYSSKSGGGFVNETDLNSPYHSSKSYERDNKLHCEQYFFYDMPIKKRRNYYNDEGTLTEEIDWDKGYTFTLEELIRKMKKEYDIDLLNIDRDKVSFNIDRPSPQMIRSAKPRYTIRYNDIYYKIDGETGETIEIGENIRTREKLDKKWYKNLPIDHSKTTQRCVLENKEIAIYHNSEIIQISEQEINSPYRTVKGYFKKNNLLESEGLSFYSVGIGTVRWYDENGYLKREINRDKEFNIFSIDNLIKKMKTEYNVDLLDMKPYQHVDHYINVSIEYNIADWMREYISEKQISAITGAVYLVHYRIEEGKGRINYYFIDATTGETLWEGMVDPIK